jgi:hypothetical protein
VSPLVSQPAAPTALRLVTLGPITLPTLKGDIVETVGDQLDAVGSGIVAGERRPRPLPLTIPVRGERLTDTDRRDAGLRLRRQVRALMENSPARLQGLYLAWSVDSEQNGWLLIGGGDLKYAMGGVVFGDFELSLTDCYRVANVRTHRAARRIVRLDRRLATVARDYLGTLFSTDFGAVSATARHYLGVAPTDVRTGSTGAPPTVATVTARDGSLAYVDGLVDGEVVDFEQAEGDMTKSIVRVYDDHGTPSSEGSWEPVFGPDQPVAGTLVLDNAVCRCVLDLANGWLDAQSWTGAAWSSDATVAHPSGASGFAARLVEWTTELAVVRVTSLLAAGVRGEMYVSLQRGWSGPRVELYARNAAGSALATVNVYAKTAGTATWQRSSAGPTSIVAGTSVGTFAGISPWTALLGPGTDRGVALAVLQSGLNVRGAVALAGRSGLAFESAMSYASVGIALGPRASVVADATAFGGQHLTDSQQVPELVART